MFTDLAEDVDASEGKEGWSLKDEPTDELLDDVSPAVERKGNHASLINDVHQHIP